MDSAIVSLVNKLAEYGPGFITAGVFGILYWFERKRNDRLIEKLHELSTTSLKADLEHTQVYQSIDKTLNILAKALIREDR